MFRSVSRQMYALRSVYFFLIRNNIMHRVTCNTFMLLIIVNLMHYNNGGCDVNDWPHSCLANFRIGKQKCEPCESGRYGCNCSENCPVNAYGPGCYTFCDCPEDEFCDPMLGCMNTTTTTHTIRETTDRATYPAGSSSPPVSPVKATNHVESSPLPTPKDHILTNLTVSLLVSVGTVVFFGTICAVILIRVSKQFYKRQYQKFLSRWQSNDLATEDTNVYAVYSYTDSLLSTTTSPQNPENATYDHSSEASYNVLSLRNVSIRGNGYGGSGCHSITPPLTVENSEYEKETNVTTERETDFDLEPECFLSLFDENKNDKSQSIVSHQGESKEQNTTKL